MSAKGNTLFAYFSKSPKNNQSLASSKTESPKSSSNIARPSGNSVKKGAGGNGSAKRTGKLKPTKTSDNVEKSESYKVHDIVWAKVDGHPWWPSLICHSPEDENSSYFNPKGKKYHVQFFDNPPTRAWISEKQLKVFSGAKHPEVPVLKDPKWKSSVERANEAFQKSRPERKCLVAVFKPTNGHEINDDDPSDCSDTEDVKRKRPLESDTPQSDMPKRRRIVELSDHSDSDEYVPNEKELSEESEGPSEVESENETPDKTVTKAKRNNHSKEKLVARKLNLLVSSPISETTKSKLSFLSSNNEENTVAVSNVSSPSEEERNWVHCSAKLDFLTEQKRKDANGKPMNHPDYNPRTIFVPESFKKTLTPASKQWWEIKSKHFDVVLFFKVGKFYELYHMDAVIGVNELGLSYMKGDIAHSGFPEKSYANFSELLVQKGYKVGRVEQTETPQMMEDRCKKTKVSSKYDKVVKRELCRVTSKGTRMYSFLEGQSVECKNNYLLALSEKTYGVAGESTYGVCFIDTSIGTFNLGQFSDDRNCSRLRTLIAHNPPTQVLFEKSALSPKTIDVLDNCLSSAIKDGLKSGSEFWEAKETLKFLEQGNYFQDENDESSACFPKTLLDFLDPDDSLYKTPKESYDLCIKCLGACIWCLKYSCIEDEVLTMNKFKEYKPLDIQNEISEANDHSFPSHMVLDGVSLLNMEIIESETGEAVGSLLDAMDFCSTPFGKRLFRQWLCAPLCNPTGIDDRLDAVEDLRENFNQLEEIVQFLKQLPDLQRLISKIHTQGSARRNENHPDSRAILYEEEIYSKRKIGDFLQALNGFQSCLDIQEYFQASKISVGSNLLKNCTSHPENGGKFPEIKNILMFFENAFDHEKAKKEGKIIPSKGVDKEYDKATSDIKQITLELERYLETQRTQFGCQVNFFGTGKNRYQLEVPDHASKKATGKHDLQGQRKGFKRYWTPEIKELLQNLMSAEEQQEVALKDIMRRIFAEFDKDIKKWEQVIECISILDVLISFTQYSLTTKVEMCRPKVVYPKANELPFLEIRQGRHPSLLKIFQDEDFIANDILIGTSDNDNKSNLVLVTGPNMGGKSTLMREAGLLVIMAQMGSFVPAEACHFTVVDRIFTRLGANDQIMEGESTFYVELSETVSILSHATQHSLILMDELGRGTSTFDGTAIAYSVVHELSDNIGCRSLFSTHYHTLVDEFSGNPKVELGHMSCIVENETDDPDRETISFLYKFAEGACPKSYGFNAAKLAGIPDEVIKSGRTKAKDFEDSFNRIKVFRSLIEESSDIKQNIIKLNELIKCC